MNRIQKIEMLRQVIGFNLNMELSQREAERILNDIEKNHEMKLVHTPRIPAHAQVNASQRALVRKVSSRNPNMTAQQIADLFNTSVDWVAAILGRGRRVER